MRPLPTISHPHVMPFDEGPSYSSYKEKRQNPAPGKKGTRDMADEEQLTLLKRSVEEWNQWRKEHLETEIDLRSADLSGANLNGANLNYADLIGADLSKADLSGGANLFEADLRGANLRGATLRGANLRGATLRGANLRGANLSEANLSEAKLSEANLSEAKLSRANLWGTNLSEANLSHATLSHATLSFANLLGADLTNVRCGGTMMAQVDLRQVIGLATIEHEGPSGIALHSVLLPSDGSAEVFLRGAGVADEWIDFYRATRLSVINYHSLFISYASQDDLLARRLHADLQAKGVRCWFAPHSLEPGDFFREKIDQAIHIQDRVLLLLSEHSVNSKWVGYEVNQAIDREIDQQRVILYPIRIDTAVLESQDGWAAALKKRRHIGDFTHWSDPQEYQRTFDQLLKHLQPKT